MDNREEGPPDVEVTPSVGPSLEEHPMFDLATAFENLKIEGSFLSSPLEESVAFMTEEVASSSFVTDCTNSSKITSAIAEEMLPNIDSSNIVGSRVEEAPTSSEVEEILPITTSVEREEVVPKTTSATAEEMLPNTDSSKIVGIMVEEAPTSSEVEEILPITTSVEAEEVVPKTTSTTAEEMLPNIDSSKIVGSMVEEATTSSEVEEILPITTSAEAEEVVPTVPSKSVNSMVAEVTASTANITDLQELEVTSLSDTEEVVPKTTSATAEMLPIIDSSKIVGSMVEEAATSSEVEKILPNTTLAEAEQVVPTIPSKIVDSMVVEATTSTANVTDLAEFEITTVTETEINTASSKSVVEATASTANVNDLAEFSDETTLTETRLESAATQVCSEDMTLPNIAGNESVKFLAVPPPSPGFRDNDFYQDLLKSSPTTLNQHLPNYQKYLVMKLEVNSLRKKIAILTVELLRKEAELIKIRPDYSMTQPIKIKTELKEIGNGNIELDEVHKEIAKLSIENKKCINDLKELQNKHDSTLNDFIILKENNLKLENELQLMKEDNVKLRENLGHYEGIMNELCKKNKTMKMMYVKEFEKRTRLETEIQKITEEGLNKTNEMIENRFKAKIQEVTTQNSQLKEMLKVLRSKLIVIEHDKENEAGAANTPKGT